jgi:hypothetical protein
MKERRGMVCGCFRLEFLPNLTASEASAEMIAKPRRFSVGQV